jgi:hypothetical protein
MRTTVELPDELLAKAKSQAALKGVSLKQFFIQAIEQKLAPENAKVRRAPPAIGSARGRRIGVLTREQIGEAMFR